MITEKISSFAIVDDRSIVIPSPVFNLNTILKAKIILYNLYRDQEYALNLRILKENHSHLVDNTMEIGKNPSKEFGDEPYNASITMTTNEMNEKVALTAGNYELEVALGKIDSHEDNAINVTTKDKSKLYFTIVESED